MAKAISRRHAFAGLGLSMTSLLPIPRRLSSTAEAMESSTPDDRMVLHLEPLVTSCNAPLEVFCLGHTGREVVSYFSGTLEMNGQLKRSLIGPDIGAVAAFRSALWPAKDYYRPVEEQNYAPDAGGARSGLRLYSETMQGSAIARVADPWVVDADPAIHARFDRVVSSYSSNSKNRMCLIGSALDYADQIRSTAWTAQLCRNRAATLISVVPGYIPAMVKLPCSGEEKWSAHEAYRLLSKQSDCTIQVQRSYLPTPKENHFDYIDLSIGEAISFVSDFLCDTRPGVGRPAFMRQIRDAQTGYFHQMFVSPSLSEGAALAAVREKITHARAGRDVIGAAFRVRYSPSSREDDALSLVHELKSEFGKPPLAHDAQLIAGRERKATVVQWLNLTNGRWMPIATG